MNYKFTRFVTEYRIYRSFYKKYSIWGQIYSEANNGEVPFQSLVSVGNGNTIRGFYNGRYIDKNKSAVQTELRYPIYKKLNGVLFAGTGKVYGEKKFDDLKFKESYGAGLRYCLNESRNINIRADFAFSRDGGAMYINIGESF